MDDYEAEMLDEEREGLNDVYDLWKKVIAIHSEGETAFTADYILSNLSLKELDFVREQMKVAHAVFTFFPEKELAFPVVETILNDVYNRVVLSRAKEGRPLNTILAMGTEATQERKESVLKKLLLGGGKKKDEEE